MQQYLHQWWGWEGDEGDYEMPIDLTTPLPKIMKILQHSPEALPRPTSKIQLMAAKRMDEALKAEQKKTEKKGKVAKVNASEKTKAVKAKPKRTTRERGIRMDPSTRFTRSI